MKKQFIEYLQNSLTEKQNILSTNTLSEEDKTLLENQVANLEQLIQKLDEAEDEITNEQMEEIKNEINTLNDKLLALGEKINLNKNNEDNKENKMEDTLKNYLESKNSVHAFAEAIRNSKTAEEFKNNWIATLKNDVDNDSIVIEAGSEEAYIPTAVKGMINDLWDKNADWLKDLNYTGAKRFYVRHNMSNQDTESSRAKGWKKGEKARQDLTFSAKLLEGGFIYKLSEIDARTAYDDDNSLIAYVLRDLNTQILYEIKMCILTGDGRQANDPYKVDSFEAIAKTTSDDYTNVMTVGDAGTSFLVDDMRVMCDSIHNPNNKPIYVFMSKADLRTLSRVSASETSTPVYVGTEVVCEQLGCDRIITTDLLGADFKAVAMIPYEYYMVGAANPLTPILTTASDIKFNKDIYRAETVAGGGLNGLKSSACLKAE